MMWRLLAIVGLFWGFMQVVYADDAVLNAVVNDPPNAWQEFQNTVNALSPTVEAVYDVHSETWGVGTSASLWNFTSHDIHLGRIKSGYLATNVGYVGADADLPGLALRYVGGRWEQLDTILGVLSKYGSTGYIVGYDTESDHIAHGPTFGASLRF